MKLEFEVYRPGEPDAGLLDQLHTVTVELHEVEHADDETREAAEHVLKPALAKLFDTSERHVYTAAEAQRVEDALVMQAEAKAEGE